MGAHSVEAKDLGVVIVTFQPDSRLTACLASVLGSVPRPGRVLVVDNASPADDLESLVEPFPGVEIDRLETNLGYGGAMNVGAARLTRDGCTRLMFMTHEVVLTDGALGELTRHLDRHPRVGLAGPVLANLSEPGTVWSAGGTLTPVRRAPRHLGAGRAVAAVQAAGNRRVRWLDGACLLARAEAIESVGGFREDLFLYCEDVDLARKLHRHDWGVECVGRALAFQESSTTPPYLNARNRALVLGPWGAAGVVVDLLVRAIADIARGRGASRARLMIMGLSDAARGRLDRTVALDRRW